LYHVRGWDHDWWWCGGCFFYCRPAVYWGGDSSPTNFVGEEGIAVCPSLTYAFIFVDGVGGYSGMRFERIGVWEE